MKIDLLDHGYIEFIEASGTGKAGRGSTSVDRHESGVDSRGTHFEFTDLATVIDDYEVGIIEAARQSTQKGFQGWDSDEKLLGYLYGNQHMTPFEFADCVIEVQAPIVVFREWHRHRTQSYNEMSARYAPLPDLYYVPRVSDVYERGVEAANTRNKQAGSLRTVEPSDYQVTVWRQNLGDLYADAEAFYQNGLALGIPKELARLGMPVGHYTRMRAKANLRNWLSFMTLRSSPNAMKEIRIYSDALGTILAQHFPRTFALFEAARKKAERDRMIVEIAERALKDYKTRGDGHMSINWIDELEDAVNG